HCRSNLRLLQLHFHSGPLARNRTVEALVMYHRSGHARVGRQHVCIVTETYPPEINGVAMTLERWVKGLRSQGHAVSIVRPRQGVELAARSDPRTTLVDGLPLPGYRGLHIGLPAGALLRRRWSERRPDAVYVATEGFLGWSAVSAARRLG